MISKFLQMVSEAGERDDSCRDVVRLNLIANRIGSRRFSSLIGALVQLPWMVELSLCDNLICEEGCMVKASALGAPTALRELDLGCNRINKATCTALRRIGRNRGLHVGLDNQAIVHVWSGANFPGIFIAEGLS